MSIIYCDDACFKDKSDSMYIHVYLQSCIKGVFTYGSLEKKERTLISISGVTSLKSSTQGE